MKKNLQYCQNYYLKNPAFGIRLFKLFVLFLPVLVIWNLISEYIITDVLHIEIPDLFKMFEQKKVPTFVIIIMITIFAPLIETLFFQKWCYQIFIWLIKKLHSIHSFDLSKSRKISTIITAFFFSLSHYSNHSIYPFLVLPAGLLLGWIYLSNLEEFNSKSRAYWMTCLFHAFYNGIGTLIYLFF